MKEEDRKELLETYRRTIDLRPWHRLFFLFASFGAGFWSLGPVFWEQTPPWWYFVLSIAPVLAYLGLVITKQKRVLKDARFSALRRSPILLAIEDLRMIWPNDEEASAFPWQRPAVILGWAVVSVCIVMGFAALIPSLAG